jgi:hypothetical protein
MTRRSETDSHTRLRKSSTYSQYSSEFNLPGPQIHEGCICMGRLYVPAQFGLHGRRVVGIDVVGINFGVFGRLCSAGRIYGVAELFGWLEERDTLGGHVDLGSGLGVATCAGVALARTEAAEAANLNLVAGLEGTDDSFEESIDDNFSVAAGEVAKGGDFVDEVSFGHEWDPFVLREGDKGRIETIPLLLIVNGMSAFVGRKSGDDQRRNISGMRCIKRT